MCSTSVHCILRRRNLAGKWSLTAPPGSLSTPVITWHPYASEIIFPICIWAKSHRNRWTWVCVTGKLCIYIKYADYEHRSFLGTSKHLSGLSFCVYCLHHMASRWEGLDREAKRSTHEFHGNYLMGELALPWTKGTWKIIVNIFAIILNNKVLKFILIAKKQIIWTL